MCKGYYDIYIRNYFSTFVQTTMLFLYIRGNLYLNVDDVCSAMLRGEVKSRMLLVNKVTKSNDVCITVIFSRAFVNSIALKMEIFFSMSHPIA